MKAATLAAASAALFIGVFSLTRSAQQPPLGIRNNNPLNMRDYGISWQGKVGSNAGFVVFDTPENGYRAAANDLKNKWLNGINTINKIVATWAPAKGMGQDGKEYTNPTAAYQEFVAKRAGMDGDLVLSSSEQYVAVIEAMTQKENGQQPYSIELIKDSVKSGMTAGRALPAWFLV